MPITIHPSSLGAATKSTAYDAALAATGGTGPYSYAVTTGSLPTGLSLSSDGIISGTPTTPGTAAFTVTATDSLTATGTANLSILVQDTGGLIVEDGTGKTNANSYISLAEVASLAAAMGQGNTNSLDAFNDLSTDEQAWVTIQAAAYIDRRFRFYGQSLTDDQALEWPRTKNYDERGRVITAGTIPTCLKKAQALLILELADDPGLQAPDVTDSQGQITSWATDGISVDFEKPKKGEEGSADTTSLFEARLPDVEVLLRSIGEIKASDWLGPNRQTVTASE